MLHPKKRITKLENRLLVKGIMMKNLVFLHGSGADCKAYHNLMSEIGRF